MSAPVGSLKHLQDLLQGFATNAFYGDVRSFPFYSALLYTPTNGLNEALHKYMVGGAIGSGENERTFTPHSEYFYNLTGPHCLVAIVEDVGYGPAIDKFKPAEVYDIARFLGVRVDQLPAIVFFTEPKEHKEVVILGLREILPDAKGIMEDDLTQMFQKIIAIVDECHEHVSGEKRLDALRKAFNKEWPRKPTWSDRVATAATWSVANGKNVFDAISAVTKLAQPYRDS